MLHEELGSVISTGVVVYNIRLDELLGTQDPRNTPARQTEALGEAINDQDIIFVDILNILSRRDGSTVTVASIVVARVKLVADQGGTSTAKILDLGQLGVGDHASSWVPRVGSQNYRSSSRNLSGDDIGVDVVAVLLRKGGGNGGKL